MDTQDIKVKSQYRKILLSGLAVLLPMLLMLLVYALCGQWPFGSKGLYAFPDSYSQYTNYYEYYRGLEQNGLLYSFSRTLGGDLVGFFTYYTLSPYNLLFLLLPHVAVGKLMTVITLLKIGTCGLTFNLLLHHRHKSSYFTLLFSTSYAMMSYLIIYSQNMNFMDAVILLPLILLGLRRLIFEKRYGLYVISLAAALIINYYTGYMLCIFAVFYFVYELLLAKRSLQKRDCLPHKRLSADLFACRRIVRCHTPSGTLLPVRWTRPRRLGGTISFYFSVPCGRLSFTAESWCIFVGRYFLHIAEYLCRNRHARFMHAVLLFQKDFPAGKAGLRSLSARDVPEL